MKKCTELTIIWGSRYESPTQHVLFNRESVTEMFDFMFFCFCAKVVAKILPFRIENKKFLDPIWNKHHIERVEIVLKETLDVKGE